MLTIVPLVSTDRPKVCPPLSVRVRVKRDITVSQAPRVVRRHVRCKIDTIDFSRNYNFDLCYSNKKYKINIEIITNTFFVWNLDPQSPCPLGTFGSSKGLKTPLCSGSCLHPLLCPLG